MKFNKGRNWLVKRAVQEDQHLISAGGLISRVGLTQQVDEPGASGLEVTQLAFARGSDNPWSSETYLCS